MKRILFLALALLSFARMASAVSYGGNITEPLVYKDAAGALVIKVVETDVNGNTASANAITATVSGNVGVYGINGTSIATAANAFPVVSSITNTPAVTCALCATAANQTTQIGSQTTTAGTISTMSTNIISVLAGVTTTGWVDLTQTAYTGVTTNATVTFSVTATAGSSAYKAYWVLLSTETGVTAMRYATANSVTAPTYFSASAGAQVFPNDNPKTVSIFSNNSGDAPHFFVRAAALSGATSGTIWFAIRGLR